jgi:hypothetical protein
MCSILGASVSVRAQGGVQDLTAKLASIEERLNALERLANQQNNRDIAQDTDVSWLSRTAPPIGSVVVFAGAWPPPGTDSAGHPWTEESLGWMLCDGRPIPDKPEYSVVRNVLGFVQVPDYRGYFLRGIDVGNKTGRDPEARELNREQLDTFKSHGHQASSQSTVSPDPHTHSVREPGGGGSSGAPGRQGLGTVASGSAGLSVTTTTTVHADGGRETRPKNVAVHFIMKVRAQPTGPQ